MGNGVSGIGYGVWGMRYGVQMGPTVLAMAYSVLGTAISYSLRLLHHGHKAR